MKHIKKYEELDNKYTTADLKEYFVYVDIEKLESTLFKLKKFNIEYNLYLLRSNNIALFIIMNIPTDLMTKEFNFIYFSAEKEPIENIKKKCEDITNLPIEEIEEIFKIFKDSQKYNI